MNEEQKLKLLENKIEVYKEKLLIPSDDNQVLENFYTVLSLNDIYYSITGKNLFVMRKDLKDMDNNILDKLTKTINHNNDLVVKEKQDVRKSLFLKGDFLLDSLHTLNDYYGELKNNIGLADSYFKEYYIQDRIANIPDRKMSDAEIDEVVNAFLKDNYSEYQDIYNIMKEEGRIFLNNDMPGSIGNCKCSCNYNYDTIEDYIIIGKHKNDLIKISSIIHELLHAIEIIKLRKNVGREDFLKFRHTSQYQEIKPFTYQGFAYDFLEEFGYPGDEIKKIRTKEILKNKLFLNSMVNNVYDFENTTYLDGSNLTLEHTLGFLTSTCLLDKKEEEFNKSIEIYNKEKLNCSGLELFDKLKIDEKTIEKGLDKQLKKCI